MARLGDAMIWLWAFGYFACYAPYSALAKAVSRGLVEGVPKTSGLAVLPVSIATAVCGMVAFLGLTGWWRYATRHAVGGWQIPGPTRFTLASGLCTSVIAATTTLSYTFKGVSIVFAMLLMRGGVLIIAPIVDAITGRRVRATSWAALGLSLAALVVAFLEDGGWQLTTIAIVDIAAYLAAYFVRLQLMSRKAKSGERSETLRFFVEEQFVATPVVLIALAAVAWLGDSSFAQAVRSGFTEVPSSPVLPYALAIGLLSQGTGIFGGLVLLDGRENSFCVPVNRSASVLAGVLASFGLAEIFGAALPSAWQFAGAALLIAAIVSLSLPSLLARRAAPVSA
ncbi:MAG: hypothetical protein RIT45_2799 [Pseudomonadota bacterium]|jgi:drug/metabolite transporter (DMT)-like permease